MVFCSCRKKTTTTTTVIKNSSTSSSSKKRFGLFFRRKQPLAYVSTELDGDDDDDSPIYTPEELKKLQSAQKSKAYVDGLLYRNRKSGRQKLLNRDGVPMFSGFLDWFNRKMLKEKKERGERYDKEKDVAGGAGDDDDVEGEGVTIMMLRARQIDPVKSGFMGKKADRDETTGCAVGTVAAAHWAGRNHQPRPSENKFVTPQKGSGGGVVGCATGCSPMGGGDSFATASTSCSPLSSVSLQEDNNSPANGNTKRVSEEGAWCDVLNSSISTEELNASPEKEIIEDYSGNVAAADEESGWCDVFHSSSILPDAEREEVRIRNKGQNNSSSAKIRGVQNVEVVYSDTDMKVKKSRSFFKKRSFSTATGKEKDSYKALQ